MKMLATEEEKKRLQEYYQKNKQRILERNKAFYLRNKERILKAKKNHYQKNREEILAQQKEYAESHKLQIMQYQLGYRRSHYFKIKMEVLSHYSNGTMRCVKCGFDDVRALSIDHIAGDGAKHRKEIGNNMYAWLRHNKFPKGYQTLCMNCQMIKKVEGREYPNVK